MPLTVVYATPADAAQRPAIMQRYRAAYAGAKGARLKAVGPSGHMIMCDQPQRFAEEVRAFLRGRDMRPSAAVSLARCRLFLDSCRIQTRSHAPNVSCLPREDMLPVPPC